MSNQKKFDFNNFDDWLNYAKKLFIKRSRSKVNHHDMEDVASLAMMKYHQRCERYPDKKIVKKFCVIDAIRECFGRNQQKLPDYIKFTDVSIDSHGSENDELQFDMGFDPSNEEDVEMRDLLMSLAVKYDHDKTGRMLESMIFDNQSGVDSYEDAGFFSYEYGMQRVKKLKKQITYRDIMMEDKKDEADIS